MCALIEMCCLHGLMKDYVVCLVVAMTIDHSLGSICSYMLTSSCVV